MPARPTPRAVSTSRREFLALLGAAGLLAGCAGTGAAPAAAPATEPATREFTHAFGTSSIPAAPQRIVTTTDQNALLPLLELGVTPVGSAGLVAEDGTRTFRRTEGFDTAGIEFVGAYGEPNAEAIAALGPDLIVGYEFDEDFAAVLDRIAPFVGVQVFGRRLADALMDFADLTGRTDVAAGLRDAYDARVAALRAELGRRHPGLTVSLLTTYEPGLFGFADNGQAIGTVAHDLDLGRPAAQSGVDRLGETTAEDVSLELLGEHDADVVLVVDFSGDDGDTTTRDLVSQPVWQQLSAARNGQLHVIDGSLTVGAAWARMGAFLDVLERHLLADGLVVNGTNA
ncbi:MAG TPA: ABC transporter substrate-binding protein [Pseudonocardia sp.]|nr:ABC transporter substrate-binding protein [Pseudonocardia sp.]